MIHRCCTCCVSCAFVSIFGKICFQKNSFDSLGCWQVVKNSSIEGEERVTRNWPDVRTRLWPIHYHWSITHYAPLIACVLWPCYPWGHYTVHWSSYLWLWRHGPASASGPWSHWWQCLVIHSSLQSWEATDSVQTWECPVAESCYNVTTLLVLPGPLLSLNWVILK